MIVQEPGHGVWPMRLAKRRRSLGRGGPCPGFNSLLAGEETSSSRPSAHQSFEVVNPAARGRSVAHTSDRPICECALLPRERKEVLRPPH